MPVRRLSLEQTIASMTGDRTMPTLTELMNALPEITESEPMPRAAGRILSDESMRPIPVGRFRRLGLMSTLQAKIGAAYMFYWLRSWFRNSAENERRLAETHWKT